MPGRVEGVTFRRVVRRTSGTRLLPCPGIQPPPTMTDRAAPSSHPAPGPSDLVTVSREDRVALVTVNRPEKLNALNRQVLDALDQAFRGLEDVGDLAAVIVTGAGDRAFVAGADIGTLVQMNALTGKDTSLHGQAVFRRIERFPVPVIAAVNGFALGGGCELALACHLRIASSKARFGLPETGLGIIPGYGGTVRLARLVGFGRAVELILTGAMVTAEEARSMGLVTHVAEPDALLPKARELASTLAARGSLALRMALEAIYHAHDVSTDEALRHEAVLFGLLAATDDMKEGMSAFLEKRPPTFRGT